MNLQIGFKFDFMKCLEVIALIGTFLCNKIDLEPEDVKKKFVWLVSVLSFINIVLSMIGVPVATILLGFLDEYWKFFYGIILLIAVVPAVVAFFERKKNDEVATIKYCLANLGFNIAGAACAIAMLCIVQMEIKSLYFLKDFYIDGIVSVFFYISLFITFSYQSAEQKNPNLDHDTSLMRVNQICNTIHLLNVYFWSFMSAVLIVAYTIYCHIHNAEMIFNSRYLWLLSIVLIFFYICGFHENENVYLVFAINVPLILSCSMYWVAWFTISRKKDFFWLVIFTVAHLLIYTFIVYKRRRIIVLGKNKEPDPAYKINLKWLRIKHWFHCVSFLVIIISFVRLIISLCEMTNRFKAA